MLKRLACSFFLLTAIGVTMGYAQTSTHRGTEFWASFMRNGANSDGNSGQLKLIVSAQENCEVTVTNPATGDTVDAFPVVPDILKVCIIQDPVQCYNDQKDGIADKGLLVHSTSPISLIIANEAEGSRDASFVLPVEDLGTQYMIQTNKSVGEAEGMEGENRASFLVVAIEDGTRVDITPTCQTNGGHAPGVSYPVFLDKGQCYHVLNLSSGTEAPMDPNGDFSGTLVESDKPIAVFNGNCLASVPGSLVEDHGHAFEQAVPVSAWGKEFVVVKSEKQKADWSSKCNRVKVTAFYDNTIVKRDKTQTYTLEKGESVVFEMDTEDTYLKSESNAIAVYLYNPAMAWLTPMEQAADEIEIAFLPIEGDYTRLYHVIFVCSTASIQDFQAVGGLSVDPTSFRQVASAEEYSYQSLPTWDPSALSFFHCPGGIVAYVSSTGAHDSYAYAVGVSGDIINQPVEIVGPSQVSVATSFWPGEYTYQLTHADAIEPSAVRWRLEPNPEGQNHWKLKEHGASCTITVYSMDERELHASWGSSSANDISITINGSGYGVEEDEVDDLQVYPHPAKEVVMVKGCAMEEIRVYNLLGQQVKTVPVNGDSEVNIQVSDLPQALYLLEIHTLKGNKTKIVSVIK